MYFSLKDRDGVISSVMFKSRVQRLRFIPKDGVEVLARGNVSVFSKQGKYQFYAQEMQLYGVGDLYWQMEQLKEKLQALHEVFHGIVEKCEAEESEHDHH